MSQETAYYAPPVTSRPTSGLAVAGFICSLLWGFGLLSLAGVILSGIAWQPTKTGQKGGYGFAVAGVIIGTLGLVVFAVLFAFTIAISYSAAP